MKMTFYKLMFKKKMVANISHPGLHRTLFRKLIIVYRLHKRFTNIQENVNNLNIIGR